MAALGEDRTMGDSTSPQPLRSGGRGNKAEHKTMRAAGAKRGKASVKKLGASGKAPGKLRSGGRGNC